MNLRPTIILIQLLASSALLNNESKAFANPEVESTEVSPVTSGEINLYANQIGTIRFNNESLSHVDSRYNGLVRKVNVKLGNTVKRGAVLATLERNTGLQTQEVKATTSGVLVEMSIAKGSSVASGERTFTIADLSKVWVELSVQPQKIASLRKGQQVAITKKNLVQTGIGSIFYIAPYINPSSRTTSVLIELNNKNLLWKPGEFVDAKIEIKSEKVELLVPRTSVLITSRNTGLVVTIKNESKAISEVNIGISDLAKIQITKGLSIDDQVLTRFPNSLDVDTKLIEAPTHPSSHSNKASKHEEEENHEH